MKIIKIGGGKNLNLTGIIRNLAECGDKCVIVHGANALRDELGEKLGIKRDTVTSLSGYSSVLSHAETIDLQFMAYAGLRNKRIVELCQQNGINAVGICGLDGSCIQGKRNRGIKVHQGAKKMLLRDLSGRPGRINRAFFDLLLDNGYTPVLTVPIMDEHGMAINSENDDIVALLSREYQVEAVVQLIEERGLLRDPANPESVISRLSRADLFQWEARVTGRIKRKLHALNEILTSATGRIWIYIADGRIENPLTGALEGKGTVIGI